MTKHGSNQRDVVLGRTLAETALLNSPKHITGIEASAAVQRAGRKTKTHTGRGNRIALLVFAMFAVLIGTAVWLIARVS